MSAGERDKGCGHVMAVVCDGDGFLYPKGVFDGVCEGGTIVADVGKHGTAESICACPQCGVRED